MQKSDRPVFAAHLRPQRQALALEPRILFDGAAASAATEQTHTDPSAQAPTDAHIPQATATEGRAATEQAPSAARSLLVLDSRIENRDQLLAQLPGNVTAIVVNSGEDGLAAISAALAQLGKVDSIQVMSHGAAGQFTLGNRTVTADNIGQLGHTLEQWRNNLNQGADIQLYGCDVGAGAAGKTLVTELARWTGADVAASSNDTGSAAAGGDWTLETRVGDIDKSIALSGLAMANFDGLLADAAPSATLDTSGSDVLLGDTFTFTVNFSNTSTQVGFAPFINLALPATGRDGDDGVSFISASYLGQNLITHSMTFDAAGNATHPLAKDASGNFIVINAAAYGMRAGDTLVVIELPFASVSNLQPVIPVQITASLSNLADTSFSDGSPDLTLRASGGFEFGNDALDNPLNDPSLIEAATAAFVVHPTVITFDQTLNTPEGETATGPNYGRTLTVTVTPAPGQTLTNVIVTQPLPDNIQVTAITPGPGGRLTSITLHDGTVVSTPAEIALLIAANDVFIDAFTVQYDNLAAQTDTVVAFYVPEVDADGQPIINPVSGDAVTITLPAPTASGQWVPLDPRDVTAPNTTIDFSGSGDPVQFIAKSITLLKTATVQVDVGHAGITPGDTLQYSLNLAISDYFAFGKDFFNEGQLIVRDQLSDGQTLTGTPTLTVTINGVAQSIALVTSTVINADGSTSMAFDIGQSLRNAFFNIRGWLNGDLAFDDTLEGAVLAVLSYSAIVGQTYKPPSGDPHSEINEGDDLGNSAVVDGTLLLDPFNLTGESETDDSATTSTIPTSTVDISLVEVNNATPPGNGELRPGDEVTFELSYDLVTGDYEQFQLTAYLPLPLFDVNGVTWTTGSDVGQWQIGPGNTNAGAVLSVSSGVGNSLVFDFGSFVTADTTGSRIVVRFTVRVGDQPFADQRSLDVLAQSSQQTTLTDRTLISSDVVAIVSVAEPVLNIKHGVVSGSNGTVSNTTGSWNPPGSGGVPFNGNITDLAAVDGNIVNIDGGDSLRLVTAIENTGGGGAFDVTTSITLPSGLSFVGGSLAAANLQIYRGDGSVLVLGTDYSVTGNQITFLDAGGQASLLAGRSGTDADSSGANLVVISYDVLVSNTIEASRSLQSTATLSNYASVNGGTDFTPVDLSDLANQQIAAPVISKVFADGSLDNGDSSASHTSGSDLVIGESMRYDIVVTLPEGSTQTLRIDDLIPPGMRLDTTFNNGLGYQIITTRAGSGALGADFAGSVVVSGFAGVGGALGGDGVDARWTFSVSSVAADNQTGNNTFVIRLQLVADNVLPNQANVSLQNNAQLTFSDPDSDTPNGTVPVDRNVALSGGLPTVTVREPTLQVTQVLTSTAGLGGYDQGDTVSFTITISNGNTGNDFSAFDISFLDNLPSQLDGLTLTGVLYQNGATNNGGVDFELVGGQLRTVNGANIDIAKGGSIVLSITGVVNASAASQSNFANVAAVQWTSLDGTVAGERSGVDGLINDGTLNDYRNASTLVIPVAQAIEVSRVGGLPDTAATNPTNGLVEQVTVGEVIRYRVVVLVPEGNNPNYQIQITLANGLEFIAPDALVNALRIAFISGGGLTSDANLIVGGILDVDGNENSPEALPITPDLSGLAPTGIFDPSRLNIVTNPDGSQTVTFDLGNVVNGNGADDDLEGISIEFNVRVSNIASNVSGAQLGVSARELVNGVGRANSDTVFETLVEPSFSGLDKSIVAFDPNPTGTTGNATVQLSFTQNGGLAAFDAQIVDSFAGGSNYTLLSVSINGVSFGPGNLPAGVTFSTTGGISVNFDQLDVGAQVQVRYQVTVPNSAIVASSNATLTWSSLPEDFTSWGGNSVGVDGTVDGERDGSSVGPNQYILRDNAGLGIISGTLWNDTASPTASATPDGAGLAGQTVTLTWAGADGLLDTTGDNLTFSTLTDANGQYHFGVLPLGVFRIDVPAGLINYPQPLGDLRVRVDSDAGSLGQVTLTLGDADSQAANAGYVEQNDAPVNTLPGTQNGQEDVVLDITGISVADIDADRDPNINDRNLSVTLSVTNGTLFLGATVPGVSVSGANSAILTLSGTQANLNLALASLRYLGNQDFNGTDTLTVVTNDQGNFGDADGDGIPGGAGDALSDTDALQIILAPVNDTPVAVNDVATALEAGGTDNGTVGIDPRGNVLSNDIDVDIATNADRLHLVSVGGTAVPTSGVVVITGQYGRLLIGSNGAYEYVVDNNNPAVQALRLAGQTLVESFSYVVADLANAQSGAILTVTLQGANDTPQGVDDDGVAIEAGGVSNGTPGSDATGNVLDNDSDVDSVANGETRTVTAVRPVAEAGTGTFTPVTGATTVVGLYGSLTINPDGSYSYVVDNDNITVQRLSSGQQLVEFFSYRLTDTGGLDDVAQLRIVVQGANDNPVASDDASLAQAEPTNSINSEVNPTGNVILFPSRPGPIDQTGGNGIDTDVDAADRPSSQLLVNGVINKSEASYDPLTDILNDVATGTTSANGTVVGGLYGTLTLGADGSFIYDVDSTNADVRALSAGQTLTEFFTYRITDTNGLTDTAQLVITVHGVNDPPVAQNVIAIATEAGGVANGTPGVNPSGDATVNSTDPDGDPLAVTFIQVDGGPPVAVLAGGTTVTGLYGRLTIFPDGSYTYEVDNGNADVEALRTGGDLLLERFIFTISDEVGPTPETDSANIFVLIRGQNDNPIATDDSATAIEAGGLNNNQPGVDPVGNVLTNDRDVDGGEVPSDLPAHDYGETRAVDSVRTGIENSAGTTGTLGSELRGTYGWLTLNADGSYSYRLDNAMAEVQALRAGDSLADAFNYTVIDASGATDVATLNISIQGSNDTPIAQNDSNTAIEAGGLANATPGVNPSGNVLANDNDVDGNGEALTVVGLNQGASVGVIGSAFAGAFGTLTLGADGNYSYVVDNTNPQVQALRTNAQTLTETFTYRIRDLAGATSTATLTITISGANDNPVAVDDSTVAIEAGGIFNGTPGLDPSGNVLSNDTDVDAGDLKLVNGIRTGTEAAGGAFDTVGISHSLTGLYGTLTINANGTYSYVVNNNLDAVQALKVGDTLVETFTYRMRDTAGATDDAQLSIRIDGAWDAPVANNDLALAVADDGSGNGIDPTRNVLPNDTDVDQGDSLLVTGIRFGTEAAGGSLSAVNPGTDNSNGTLVNGLYGQLIIGADGNYTYHLDSLNPTVLALGPQQFLNEQFTYQVTDRGGQNDLAQINILIQGRNTAPIPADDAANAVEAGGLDNNQPGIDPSGNVLTNDRDNENDALHLTGIHTGSLTEAGTVGSLGTPLRGLYGDLLINADGSYTYTVDNSLAAVQALRQSGQTLSDLFSYTVADELGATSQAQLLITIDGRNDTPVAVDDGAIAVEAGGLANGTPGSNGVGNVLSNDSDVDSVANGESKQVLQVSNENGQTAAAGQVLNGRYGQLTLNADGSYNYLIDNSNPTVQALRTAGQTLSETFTYRMADTAGATSDAILTVTLQGANDTPQGVDDEGVAIEAGGVSNGTPGSDATGNVLDNDSDVDSVANGETRTVTAVRPVAEAGTGTFTPVTGATTVVGLYGSLTINPDGSYSYIVDNNNLTVQRLSPGQQLIEFFSYRLTDTGGLDDVAQLRIVVQGANDNPVASDDSAEAQAEPTNGITAEVNPTGNVILFPSRPGPIDQTGGNGIDTDVDAADRPSSQLLVNGVINKSEATYDPLTDTLNGVASGTTSANGTVVTGLYGTLTLGADGSYLYDVDSTNADVQALSAGQTLTEFFTYQITDTNGLTDTAQLVITVHGVNDPPVAQNVVAIATEKGGVANGTAGVDPSGDAMLNSIDPDGDPLNVTFIQFDGGTPVAVVAAGTTVTGLYGRLTIFPDGSYTYEVDNSNADVEALRTGGDLLLERFIFTISDEVGPTPETDTANIFVLIRGQNDNPIATDDSATAIEAGGLNNNQPGVDPVGNVLTNDTDVDGGEVPSDLPAHDYGETRAVDSVRTGIENSAGTTGTLGSELRGTYGWLTLNADGSYSYRLDNAMAEVQALRAGDSLADAFNYTVIDASGATDVATLNISIQGRNDTPIAQNDSATAIEAGGQANASPGVNPGGNVLANDSDVDGNGEVLTVVELNQGASVGVIGTAFAGAFGTLTLEADGNYSYVVDNNNPQVQALRTNADTLTETFTYRILDLAGATSTATLTITIRGANDNPVAVDDSTVAVEAGGTFNGTPGLDPSGNVLGNDTDVDAGDGKQVTDIRSGSETAGGAFDTVGISHSLTGLYGTLTINADGTYSYVVNNNLAAVQALKVGDTLVETFTYRMRDTAGATDDAQLSIRIDGAWDAPVANNDLALAVADDGSGNGVNPTRNVLPNDTDVDQGDSLLVTGIRFGTETAGGSLAGVNSGTDNSNGTLVNGLYGQLIIGADGNYTYDLDSLNPTVLALGPLQFLDEHFTYQVTDRGGQNDLAEIHIIIRGRNTAPIPADDAATAIEAGGIDNSQPGIDPSGNVLDNDRDNENDALHLIGIHTGPITDIGTVGSLGTPLRGQYGDLLINADGSYTYTVDNSLAVVQALRQSGQTLSEVFSYTVVDIFGATSQAQLQITVDGRNDTPVAVDDGTIAVEAGGVANGTPGSNGIGNVLSNDSDVDSVANGESKQVLQVSSETGQSAAAGQVLIGRYGQLTLNADGSYSYLIDNSNPTVQALRTAGETLSETFTYRMRDTAGATADARLTVVIQGANDAPVAQNDSNTASDQTPAPQATGNVLPNDGDVDGNDRLHVVAVRSGAESGSGTAGVIGQPIAGLYGTLVLNADGSYTYTIDQSNPQVLAAAGLGQVLQDVFTYTVNDLSGASDQAELQITLDIATPFIPAPAINVFARDPNNQNRNLLPPDPQPAVFITPVVERNARLNELSSWDTGGSNMALVLTGELRSDSLGDGLGVVPGQFVAAAVRESRIESELDLLWILGRQGRTDLTADGLLGDPSLFANGAPDMLRGSAQVEARHEQQQGRGFSAQLRNAGQRLHPTNKGN
ncbi:VCBS domain-containing protein [Pseudomonas fluorescens]|uniref:VCBS domain-containing protein n=4 Tax=Pseudomonas TaxID=286 RepID=UPI001C48D55B|nr:VCBS domain-containing protein [Pseudomonas fluorescens]QXN47673.1 VCBS domain-containing protein [Pseudomonas fluorescens]WSO21977.1 VCBS domain-containing protein [Pseudomonas fluorescens]